MMPSVYGLFAALGCITGVLWLRRHAISLGLLGVVLGAFGLRSSAA
jgi:hypothetical protein